MKKLLLLLAIVAVGFLSGCEGPAGPQGANGYSAESEVFDLQHVDLPYDSTNGYNFYYSLNPQILASDVVLIYRLSGTVNSTTPIWQSIPRTLFFSTGEVDYDFDFSKQDFTIYVGGTYPLTASSSFVNDQTFRIVIIPGYFSNKSAATANVDMGDYDAVIKAFHIDDSNVKVRN